MQPLVRTSLLLVGTAIVLLLAACAVASDPSADRASVQAVDSGALVQHASGFDIEQRDGFWLLTVTRPWLDARSDLQYALLPRQERIRGEERSAVAADIPRAATVIRIPVRSIATFSASFLAPLEILDARESWVGHDEPARVYAEWARERVDSGMVARLGDQTDVDVERLLMLQPDLVMINEYEPDGPVSARLAAAGLPVLVNGDWLETSPLGRAEWIKVFGLLYDRWEQALQRFAQIEQSYSELRDLAADTQARPTVLTNAPYGGVWSVPAGGSYTAQLLRDAGADYLWDDSPGTGALHLDLEQVFLRARDADVWINPGAWQTLADAARQDPRLTAFEAYRDERVYNFDRRITAAGGNDYFESGPYRPDLVLADLTHILHPCLLPDHELYYYRRIAR